MRSAFIASSLLASLALSKPLGKREYVYESTVTTVYTTVTAGTGNDATAPPQHVHSTHHRSETTVATVTVTSGSVPTSAAAPVESSTPVTTEAAAPATSTSAAAVASATGANTYQNTVLNQHNLHRTNHSVSALTWDDNLASIAQTIAESCVYAHNTAAGGGGYGQNIGAGTTADEVGSMITNEMYNGEINFYPTPFGADSPDMTNFEKWGHFSQIVWESTTSVGCATVDCSSSGLANVGGSVPPVFTVCNYSPPGNYAGEYSNVKAPSGQASVTV